MTIDEIKKELARKAILFRTGGKRPANTLGESWIGSVRWKLAHEELPIDSKGKAMNPLATIFVPDSTHTPKELKQVSLVTIFVSDDLHDNLIDVNQSFCIRTYSTLDHLVGCEWNFEKIKAFPLVEELVDDDYPTWDDGGIPEDLFDVICEMEEEETVDYFEDIIGEIYGIHKIGGYPAFCQSGHWFGEGYEFVLQISSDYKAQLNIVDSGNFYFFYHPQKNDWKVYCDFY